jgi:hypothetical protein
MTMRVLHITAHLGGGVGRVLSQVAARQATGNEVENIFVCLEIPRTREYLDVLSSAGVRVLAAPDPYEMGRLLSEADIVQVEWWHHPLVAEWLCRWSPIVARLIIWAHTSGLHYPSIPPFLAAAPHAFMLTTAASLGVLPSRANTWVVSSSGGFDDFPQVTRGHREALRFGYMGAPNFAKLHPDIAAYLGAVGSPDFRLEIYGDPTANPALAAAAAANPRLCLKGYTDRPGEVLVGLDVLVYLLNPTHYGTTENALIEAMACGVVPVVLNNPVETAIVEHGRTGLVVDSPTAFAAAIARLEEDSTLRRTLSANACASVRTKFAVEHTVTQLEEIYRSVLEQPRRDFDFASACGRRPAEWFLAGLGRYADCFATGEAARHGRLQLPFLYERTKSSAFQFWQYFPDDPELTAMAAMLEQDLLSAAPFG